LPIWTSCSITFAALPERRGRSPGPGILSPELLRAVQQGRSTLTSSLGSRARGIIFRHLRRRSSHVTPSADTCWSRLRSDRTASAIQWRPLTSSKRRSRLVSREPADLSLAGFAAQVRAPLDRRIGALAQRGRACRDGGKITLGRNLIGTLRNRELDAVGRRLASQTGLAHLSAEAGKSISGV
jgi:Protein of unknown function (DUF3363)